MTRAEMATIIEDAWQRDLPRQQMEAERIAREVSKA